VEVDQARRGSLQRFWPQVVGLRFFQLLVANPRPDDRHIIEANVAAFGDQTGQQFDLFGGIGFGDAAGAVDAPVQGYVDGIPKGAH